MRVVRGPDWEWGNQDGGEGFVGTVVKIGRPGSTISPENTVVVIWDTGIETNYRVGYDGSYDLRLLDNAPAGVKHHNIICDGCHCKGISGLRFKCTRCYDFDLCLHCYMADKHDLSHVFQRFDTYNSVGVELPPRQGSTKILLRGIFIGAIVQRGNNWDWGDQDGGPGKRGRVLDVRGWGNESWRSVANVAWSSGYTNMYSVGHKGRVDLLCVEPAVGGHYYRSHLPILGEKIEEHDSHQDSNLTFIVGESVSVTVDVEALKKMQEGHGGWNPRMSQIVGEIGIVHRFTEKGDIRVYYPTLDCRWTLNPSVLKKVGRPHSVGDKVKILNDRRKVELFQAGHGEWISAMTSILGKVGRIVQVYKDGDLRVTVEGQTWTLNPNNVEPVSECVNTNTPSPRHHGDSVSSLLSSLMENKLELESGPSIESIVKEAAKGNSQVVLDFMKLHPHLIDGKLNNKTCLQVASHQGHVALVTSLLGLGADFNLSDDEGDKALHYAAFGEQAEVIGILLTAGADPNAVNNSLSSPLHVAVSRQNLLCIKALLNAKANVNLQDSYGDTVLHDAIGNEVNEAVELLCSTPGLDLSLKNKRGFNPLHHAALKGNLFATDKLISRARQLVDVKKDDGFAALHLAAFNGHRAVVESLVTDGKATLDLVTYRKQTPLMLAVSQGHSAVIEFLVGSGSNLALMDEDGDTCLHFALMKRSTITAPIPEAEAPTIFGIWEEVRENNPQLTDESVAIAIACYLVQEGCPMLKNSKNKTPLDIVEGTDIGPILEQYVNNGSKEDKKKKEKRPVECGVCSELSEENVRLDPCGHRIACEDCSARLKKCIKCSTIINRRLSNDGRVISYRPRQPTAECLRYLETKIAEIEETHSCSICMERRRNVAFLCGHGACDKCAAPLRSCHMCRKTITKKINLY